MKIKILPIALFALACFAACGVDARLDPIDAASVTTKTYKSTATVVKIDTLTKKVTLDHDDIPGYMKAMTMTESVSSPEVLSGISVGDRVEFEIELSGTTVLISRLTKIAGGDSANGAEIFKANCARCHGDDGSGTKNGIPLNSGHALHHSEEEYFRQVTKGKEPKMPAFRGKLSDAEISAVVEHVRRVIQADAKKSESDEHHKH